MNDMEKGAAAWRERHPQPEPHDQDDTTDQGESPSVAKGRELYYARRRARRTGRVRWEGGTDPDNVRVGGHDDGDTAA